MPYLSNSVKFLEACDPSLRKEGTDFNTFFSNLKLEDTFYIDRSFDIDMIIDVAEKQYGLVITIMSSLPKNPGYEFKVTNYLVITLEDFRYNSLVAELNKISIEERLRIKERLSKVFCLDCMEKKQDAFPFCSCDNSDISLENVINNI